MALNAANIRVGAARIYMGVTPPTSGEALNLDASGVPPDGTEVGLTEGEAVFTYEVTYFESEAEQSLAAVAVFATQEQATLEFTMKEYVQANIQDHLHSLVAVTTNAAPVEGSQEKDIYEGGRASGEVSLQSVTLVAPIPNTADVAQRYTWAMLYQAYQSEAAAMRFTKSGDTLLKTTFKAIADLTRADTSTLFQVGVERNV